MNEQNNIGQSEWATPAGWGGDNTAPASIAEPVLSDAYGAAASPEAPSAPAASKLPWFAAVAGALVLLVGGGFFALTAFGSQGGAATPEEAVDALIEAANNEDFITIAELLEPSERRTLAEPVITEIVPELIRLGVLDESADVGNVEGFEWEFSDITYRVEQMALNDDMVHVFFTGGQAAAEFNAAEFPFGDDFRERFGDDIENEPRITEDVEDTGNPMVLVERDGRWYMSALFTMAENIRLDAGERLPGIEEAPIALGSDSPEAAVEAMFAEMVEMDLAGLIGRMDPEELAVLYRYAPIFLDSAQRSLDQVRSEMESDNMTWDLRDFDLEVETDGDDAVVTLRGFTFQIESNDFDLTVTYSRDRITGRMDVVDFGHGTLDATPSRLVIDGVVDGEPFNIEVDIDTDARSIEGSGEVEGTTFSGSLALDETGECSRYSVTASDGTQEEGCLEDQLYGASGDFIVRQYVGVFDRLGDEFGGIPIATRRTDGAWYVSPTTTTLNYYISSLQDLDEGEFEQLLDSMEFVTDAGFGTVGNFDNDVIFDNGSDNGSTDAEFDEFMEQFDAEFDEEFGDDFSDDFDFPETTDFPGLVEAVPEETTDLSVANGSSLIVEDDIAQGLYDVTTVELSAGDVITVTVEADPDSDLDTTLEIFGPNGSIAYNDDALSEIGIGFLDSHVKTQIEQDGVYTIEVHSFADGGEGAYTLTVTRS